MIFQNFQKFSEIFFKKPLTNQNLSDIIIKQSGYRANIKTVKNNVCECAGIGRQARLRGVCQPTYGFKSHHSHLYGKMAELV